MPYSAWEGRQAGVHSPKLRHTMVCAVVPCASDAPIPSATSQAYRPISSAWRTRTAPRRGCVFT